MPRSARISFEQGFFHVFNRGINKAPIFHDEVDYHTFLARLEALKKTLGFDHSIYAYSLMPNHFHLLLQTRKTPLSHIMTSLCTSYVMKFNRRHERCGGLFENRFKSKLCDTDSYFMGGSRYIILNAIRAGLSSSLGEYPWDSYHELFGKSRYQIIDTLDVERLIGKTLQNKAAYRTFLLDGITRNVEVHDYGFKRDIEGPSRFNSLSQKKFLRRNRKNPKLLHI